MKKTDLSIIIPVYKRYENVYNLLKSWEGKFQFNRIFVVMDKIDYSNLKDTPIDTIQKIYHFKNLVSEMRGITIIRHTDHKGIPGIAEAFEMVGFEDEENCIFLEDDLVVGEKFFGQCQHFFENLYSYSTPVFIGYSKTNGISDHFFMTYNPMPTWGIVTKGKILKGYSSFYKLVQSLTEKEKREIIHGIEKRVFSSTTFEKYKYDQLDINTHYFLSKPHILDVVFMVYLLKDGLGVIKNCDCGVENMKDDIFFTCKKSNYENPNVSDPVEMDILNSIHLWC